MSYDVLTESPKAEGVYMPDEDSYKFLVKAYTDLTKDQQLKTSSYRLLNDRTLQQFWDDSINDYNVYVPPARADDWMKMYRRPISRDKVNTFISQLSQSLIVPVVRAQNKNQEIDRTISRVLRALLQHAENNDGKPSKSGLRKFVDAVHKMIVEGTVHIQDDFDSEEGKANKEIVPNEEIFIANYWQPDIQKQPHLMRLQDKITYEEAKRQFGNLDNFKYVVPGDVSHWQLAEAPFFKEFNLGRLSSDEVHILRVWRDVPDDKLTRGRKREKYFNVIINGVLMFEPENKSPYRHGFYPIYKEVFEMFDAQFYWGNSLPGKARSDQAIYDSFYTLVLNKGKRYLNPPMAALNGLYIDEEVLWPGKVTPVQGDPTKDLVKIPGVSDPISNSDVSVLNLLERSIDSSTASPVLSGHAGVGKRTAREAILQESNSRILLGLFGLMIGNLVEQGGYIRIHNLVQFMPRKKINNIAKVSLPNQTLQTGRRGDIEVIFQKQRMMTGEELLQESARILRDEEGAEHKGSPKEIIYIDPEYLDNLDLYVEVTGETLLKPDTTTERALQLEKFKIYQTSPVFNQEESARALVRAFEDDEDTMIVSQTQAQPQALPMQPQQATPIASRLALAPERAEGAVLRT